MAKQEVTMSHTHHSSNHKRFLLAFASAFSLFLFACSETPAEDGKNGADGADGKDGTSCIVKAGTAHAFDVYCEDVLIGYLDSGTDGADGADGTSCTMEAGTEHAFDVYCGDTLIGYLDNGTDGDKGEDGLAGSSGSQGEPGSAGSAGADGTSCWTVESEDKKFYEMWCGASSSSSLSGRVPKAMCGANAYNPETHFCDMVNPYELVLLCSGESYNTATHFCDEANSIVPLCNGESYNTATHYCNENIITIFPLCGEVSYNPTTHYCAKKGDGTVIGVNALLLDTRDSKTYKTIQIDEQVWMAENLNFIPESGNFWCYAINEDNCTTYGRLYDWATAMNGSSTSSAMPSGVQGVCPVGWHLPSDGEWDVLATAIGGESGAGTKLKANSSLWSINPGTDDYGFSALPGSYLNSQGYFGAVGFDGYWWSATEDDASNAYYLYLNTADLLRSIFYKEDGFSVRCLQD